MWGPFRHLVGLMTDAADAGGNVLARLRELVDNRVGPANAQASTTGSANAKLNALVGRVGTTGTGVRANVVVQRGLNSGRPQFNNVNIAIAAVDMSLSFVNISGLGGTSFNLAAIRGFLASPTVLTITYVTISQEAPPANLFAWEVISFQ